MMQTFFDYSEEVMDALQNNKPILALESTLITHGMPYPDNIKTAQQIEKIARDKKVTPATIAIMHGKIKIGLNNDELNELVADKKAVKASTRDIPFVLKQKQTAGTTVAATLFCAHRAGILVFATGGIGGVHRGEEGDVSADLIELSRTPMAVICAGAKAILDLPKTLEYLETFSIPVIGFNTDYLPAFYSRQTSHPLTMKVETIAELSELLAIHWQLKQPAGILIMNPIPSPHEIPSGMIEPVITNALKRAQEQQISGKAITPFLLNEVSQATTGNALRANVNLILNNIQLGVELAHAVHEIKGIDLCKKLLLKKNLAMDHY